MALAPAEDPDSDDAIMAEIRRGEPGRFPLLRDRYDRRLVSFLASRCPPTFDPEDFAQEAWLRVFQQAPQYQARARFAAWLFQIGVNCLLDAQRSDGRRFATLEGYYRERRVDPDADPEQPDGYFDAEFHAALTVCLGKLPERTRDIVRRRAAGEENQGIAADLRISQGTCSAAYTSALRKLADCVKGGLS